MVLPTNTTWYVGTIESTRIRDGAKLRTRPDAVYADMAYECDEIRRYLASPKIRSNILRRIWKAKKGRRGTSKRYARARSSVERFLAWLKYGFRRTSTRYERLLDVYMAFVNLAVIVMYGRVLG